MATITVTSSNIENIELGELRASWSARGDRILRYYLMITHKKMHLQRDLSAPELFLLQQKADALIAAWDAKYAEFQVKTMFQSGRDAAEEQTAQAEASLESLRHILAATLRVNDAVDWDGLKDASTYPMPELFPEPHPVYQPVTPPSYSEPQIGFLDWLLGRKTRLLDEAEAAFNERFGRWQEEEAVRTDAFQSDVKAWESRERQFWDDHATAREAFLADQAARNTVVDDLRAAELRGDTEAVIEHATLVLDASDYRGLFDKKFALQYKSDEKLLMVAYDLPNSDKLPKIQSVKFNKPTGEFKSKLIPEREQATNFESVCYQVCLRTIHELFEADVNNHIDSILFNGYVDFVDKRTGKDARSCILSVLAERSDFVALDLSRVDPKVCFRSLKGVSAASLAGYTPIPPVMEMNREDHRFVEAHEVVIEEGYNLASMPWEEFEQLIRELFEKEFRARGGEVKVTQASRDGGVDAVAFDPDPISGGKIVIQAKRYTRTVGVSAVRDLYGTVLNEGASKGVLVTTSDFGADSHQFANGKPLTLLSGGNLLFMLQRHGYNARIDLAEARAAEVSVA